jgi:ribonuclease HII
MVAGAVRTEPEALPSNVADSKRLTPDKREEIAARLCEDDRVETATAAISVERIDDPATDMNTLTVAAQAEALARLARDGDTAVVDAGDVNETRFGRRVADAVREVNGWEEGDRADAEQSGIDVTAEHGADDTHAIVAAASVLAKVERDRRMAEIGERHERPVGSGYPSDTTTREFLEAYVAEYGDLPECTRRSWSTAEDLLADAEQSGLGEFRSD